MPGDIVNVKTNEVEKQRLSYIAITLSNWSTNTEPVILAGSKCEVAGSLYEFTADEDIDYTSQWAGIANSRWVYAKLVPSGSTSIYSVLTTSAPTWSTSKQGYYGPSGSTNATHRYIAKFYKDSGNYEQKAIYINRETCQTNGGLSLHTTGDTDKKISFNDTSYIQHRDATSDIYISKDIEFKAVYYQHTTSTGIVLYTWGDNTTTTFTLHALGEFTIEIGGSGTEDLEKYQGNRWINMLNRADTVVGNEIYGLLLLPGKYRVQSAGGGATRRLYITNVFGRSSASTSGDILTT